MTPTSRTQLLPLVIAVFVAVSFATRAHHFWIQPSDFTPTIGERVDLDLRVGPHFPGEAFPRSPSHLLQFEVIGDTSTNAVTGSTFRSPAGRFAPATDGLKIIRYDSQPSHVTLDPTTFAKYLDEEGLEHVAEIRRERSIENLPVHERFVRCAKALVIPDGDTISGHDRAIGQTLEIVLISDVSELIPGSEIEVRLLWLGNPAPNHLIRGFIPSRTDMTDDVRTDQDGVATLTVPTAGAWMIGAVHIEEVTDDPEADWESHWATLTVEVRE